MVDIQTERLAIKNFSKDDWKALKKIILQYELSPYAIYDHQWPTSDDEIIGVVEWFASNDSFLAVRLKESDVLIGYISLNSTDNNKEFNIGYCFDFEFHNKGYATESCLALIDYAFNSLNVEKLVTGTAIENKPSCRLLNRLGMTKVSEDICSFKNDADGKPIEFIGASFELKRDIWILKKEV